MTSPSSRCAPTDYRRCTPLPRPRDRIRRRRAWPVEGELTALHLADNPEPGATEILVTEEASCSRATYAIAPLTGTRTLLKAPAIARL